jgi:hypothetical protein
VIGASADPAALNPPGALPQLARDAYLAWRQTQNVDRTINAVTAALPIQQRAAQMRMPIQSNFPTLGSWSTSSGSGNDQQSAWDDLRRFVYHEPATQPPTILGLHTIDDQYGAEGGEGLPTTSLTGSDTDLDKTRLRVQYAPAAKMIKHEVKDAAQAMADDILSRVVAQRGNPPTYAMFPDLSLQNRADAYGWAVQQIDQGLATASTAERLQLILQRNRYQVLAHQHPGM